MKPSSVRNLALAMAGTGLLMGLAFPLVVAPFAEYRDGMRLTFAALCIVAGLVVGGLNFLLVRVFVLGTIRRVGSQLETLASGEGALTSRVTLVSDDDLGRLVQQFNALLDRLQGTLRRVIEISDRFVAHASGTSETAHSLVASSDRKREVVAGSVILLENLRREFQTMHEIIERLQDSAGEGRSAVDQQVAGVEGINSHVEQLLRQSQSNAEGLARTGAAISRTSANTQELTSALDDASASMAQMDATVREIEQGLGSSATIAERMAADATQGEEAVGSTEAAMERIRASVESATGSIRLFTQSVTEIAAITEVIEEVTEQTNLLALNAAIIAAQAGRHGQGFAVVADQIKKLADRTASSTQEIGGLIQGFREQAASSLASMSQSQEEVAAGVGLSRRAGESLGRIRESAATSNLNVQSLSKAIREIATTAHVLARSVESIAGRSKEISAATTEQGQGLEGLTRMVDETRQAAETIAGAVHSQLAAARRIQEHTGTVGNLVLSSNEAIRGGREQTDLLGTTIETLQDLDQRERESFTHSVSNAVTLGVEADGLRREIERLRPADGDGRHGASGA